MHTVKQYLQANKNTRFAVRGRVMTGRELLNDLKDYVFSDPLSYPLSVGNPGVFVVTTFWADENGLWEAMPGETPSLWLEII